MSTIKSPLPIAKEQWGEGETTVRLIIDNLTQMRGTRLLHENLSFDLSSGEGLVLTGPNGVGKTTLLRTIAGFIPPLSGTVSLAGAGEDAHVAEHCHFVGHLNAVKASLTVAENLAFWADFLGAAPGRPATDAVEAAMERLTLVDLADIPAGYLSAGQRRRLGLARLLVAKRPIWLLDEPTVSLDAASRAIVDQLVAGHIKSGGMAIVATHLPLAVEGIRSLELVAPRAPHDEAAA